MARSDLLVSLVKAGSSGDTARARSVAEAIIAEERVKRHNVLADRLTEAMRVNGADSAAAFLSPDQRPHGRFLAELTPRKKLADLVLTDVARRACEELIEEQHRASVLRIHSLKPRHPYCSSGRRETARHRLPKRPPSGSAPSAMAKPTNSAETCGGARCWRRAARSSTRSLPND